MRLTTILEITRCVSSSYKGESSKFEKRHSNAVLKTSTSSTCVRNQVAQFNWPSTIQVSFFFFPVASVRTFLVSCVLRSIHKAQFPGAVSLLPGTPETPKVLRQGTWLETL